MNLILTVNEEFWRSLAIPRAKERRGGSGDDSSLSRTLLGRGASPRKAARGPLHGHGISLSQPAQPSPSLSPISLPLPCAQRSSKGNNLSAENSSVREKKERGRSKQQVLFSVLAHVKEGRKRRNKCRSCTEHSQPRSRHSSSPSSSSLTTGILRSMLLSPPPRSSPSTSPLRSPLGKAKEGGGGRRSYITTSRGILLLVGIIAVAAACTQV